MDSIPLIDKGHFLPDVCGFHSIYLIFGRLRKENLCPTSSINSWLLDSSLKLTYPIWCKCEKKKKYRNRKMPSPQNLSMLSFYILTGSPPQHTTILSSITRMLSFWECQRNEIIQSVTFWDVFSPSETSLKSIQVLGGISHFFLFIAEIFRVPL